tara:strand:+ start:4100 stop:4315 length:216 start_codon:yes stop_codon:yes gene_type:complete
MFIKKYCKPDRPPFERILMTQSDEPIPNYHVYGERDKQSPTTLYWGTSRADAESTYDSLMNRYMFQVKAIF